MSNERRAEEARKQELEAQLDAFRQHQSEIDRSGETPDAAQATAEFGSWGTAGRKRRKKDEGGKGGKSGLGVKVRRLSSANKGDEKKATIAEAKLPSPVKKEVPILGKKEVVEPPVSPAGGLLGLVAYGSDDDD